MRASAPAAGDDLRRGASCWVLMVGRLSVTDGGRRSAPVMRAVDEMLVERADGAANEPQLRPVRAHAHRDGGETATPPRGEIGGAPAWELH